MRVEEDPLPNAIADLVWSLGLLEDVFDDLPAIVRRVAEMIPTRLGAFTVLELANVLAWSGLGLGVRVRVRVRVGPRVRVRVRVRVKVKVGVRVTPEGELVG